ncbi:MAG: hypothetical protein ACRDYX_15150 [Egibacteraceae bacterium]
MGCERSGCLGGLTLACEVCDWRRFARAGVLMGFVGLVPSELLLGPVHPPGCVDPSRQRPCPHPTGRVCLGLPAPPRHWHDARRRQDGASLDTKARSWAAQLRLHRRFAALLARKKPPSVVAVAVARKLAGFVWAEMTADVA